MSTSIKLVSVLRFATRARLSSLLRQWWLYSKRESLFASNTALQIGLSAKAVKATVVDNAASAIIIYAFVATGLQSSAQRASSALSMMILRRRQAIQFVAHMLPAYMAACLQLGMFLPPVQLMAATTPSEWFPCR